MYQIFYASSVGNRIKIIVGTEGKDNVKFP